MARRPNAIISSTARDLPEHRRQVAAACERIGYFPLPMENLPASPDDAVRVSLALVDQADLYVGVFAHRYGYVPAGAARSITEMEYDRARERGLPCLIYFMHDDHPVKASDVETGPGAEALRRFKERLATSHVAGFFASPDDLRAQVIHALAALKQPEAPSLHGVSDIPAPPEVYVAHPYTLLQTRQFVGRRAELNLLTDWVAAPTSAVHAARVFCLVALGGMGKSALTWKWFHDVAPLEMKPLAGRLWWSFYESDAGFDNFLIRATAYVTRRPTPEIEAMDRPAVERRLLHHLDRESYLVVLDGLERALVAYARFDAAHVSDDDLDRETDNRLGGPAEVAAPHRLRKLSDPRAGKFLRQLAQVRASRVLVSSRLYPADLQNAAGQALGGCHAHFLTGLSDDDAVGLWRDLGVTGSRERLLALFHTFGSHPLLVQTLAGAIANYRPSPGDFEAWQQAHPLFDPFTLPLTQVKTHVLRYALAGLGTIPRKVLESVAGFRMPAGYQTLAALHTGRTCPNPDALHQALEELEDRGLLGWDRRANRYDLHPIVRGVTWGSLSGDARDKIYRTLTAHFANLPASPYDEVKRIEDLTPAIELYHGLIGLRRYPDAFTVFVERLEASLFTILRATRERRQLLECFFPDGVEKNPALATPEKRMHVLSSLALCYDLLGHPAQARALHDRALNSVHSVDLFRRPEVVRGWFLSGENLLSLGRLYAAEKCFRGLYELLRDNQRAMRHLEPVVAGLRAVWQVRGVDGPPTNELIWVDTREAIRRPDQEEHRLLGRHRLITTWTLRHSADEEELLRELRVARDLGHIEEELACLVSLAHLKHSQGDPDSARLLLGDVWDHAENGPYPLLHADALNLLAAVEREADNRAEAAVAATRAYSLAWCDGPPYAYKPALDIASEHLSSLRAELPHLPALDPAKCPPFPPFELSSAPDDDRLRHGLHTLSPEDEPIEPEWYSDQEDDD